MSLAAFRLARTEGVGPVLHRRLMARHGSAEAALDALGPRACPRDVALREMEALERMGARLLFLGAPDYPSLLAELDDAPLLLAAQGDMAALDQRCVAMVGARNASALGRRFAEDLADALAVRDVTIVSGLARGIDTAAHLGALRSGRTVAAVAGGLDHPYPPENAKLQARIAAEGGLVLSEAPLGAAPRERHFPRRNRIVAGVSLGVVVVEAALQSGTLITARLAAEAGRELFAVPGHPLDPRCRGSNELLRRGAQITETAADVLDHLPTAPVARRRMLLDTLPQAPELPREVPPAPSDAAAQLLESLGPAAISVDELGRRCQLSPSALAGALMELELAGRIETLPGNRVALR
ncbi:DNA-processing protein DprA [Roseococcus microcysteis]|uniref:DNA-processing protein DprA n=1 Tax=Roseococcus microcysteis TaxID=2771361 RepID=UPI00168B938B|nr:DNA-processing protein DprA [Roseococcus microcysteis]